MMGGWLAGWFECGSLMIWYRLLPFIPVSGTGYHCLFVCFFNFLIFAKVAILFFAERTHFFLTSSPPKNLKIAKYSP